MASSTSAKTNAVIAFEKAALVAAVGGVISLVFFGGSEPIRVLGGLAMPKFVAEAGILSLSTVGAQMALPPLLKATGLSSGVGVLNGLEISVLNPMLTALLGVGLESVLAPQALAGQPLLINLGIQAALSIGTSYLLINTGLSKPLNQA